MSEVFAVFCFKTELRIQRQKERKRKEYGTKITQMRGIFVIKKENAPKKKKKTWKKIKKRETDRERQVTLEVTF